MTRSDVLSRIAAGAQNLHGDSGAEHCAAPGDRAHRRRDVLTCGALEDVAARSSIERREAPDEQVCPAW